MSLKSNKTKKNRKKTNKHHDKKKMWELFDENIKSDKVDCILNEAKNTENCDICGHKLLINDINYLTCSNSKCAVMFTEILDFSPEWRFYGADDNNSSDPTRCGMPINPLLKESSFGCKVLTFPHTNYEMKKIRRYTEWQSMPYKEKSHYDEFQRISIMAYQGGIPKIIVDDAIRYHKMVTEKKTFRGLNRDGIIAASIYIACRINQNPRTAKEIAQMFNLDVTSATRGCKNATLIINELESNMVNTDKTSLCKTKPESFINRYCSKLNINQELTKLCLFISIKIYKNNIIPENTPHAIAAGIIYFISHLCNLNISKQQINNVSDISEVTINKCFKKLQKKINELVPQKLLKKYNNTL